MDAVVGDDPPARRDRAVLELLYGTGCRISEAGSLSLPDVDLHDGLVRLTGKGAKERIVPLGRCAAEALERWLAPAGRGALEPTRWARRGDAEAVFLNQRGGRLSRQGLWLIVRRHGDAAGIGSLLTPSCAAPFLRHPHARRRCRHTHSAGDARPRLDLHHPDLHPGVDRAPQGGLPVRPPPSHRPIDVPRWNRQRRARMACILLPIRVRERAGRCWSGPVLG